MTTRKSPSSYRGRPRRGLSMILLCFLLVVLIAFVSMAVDIGRVRLARAQLQTAADAAAFAGARALEYLPGGVATAQDEAIDAAAENESIDQVQEVGARRDSEVAVDRDEDIQFGIWRKSTRTFHVLQNDSRSTIDERREANAIRVWGRRCTSFIQDGQTIQRDTGIPLIFGPVIGVSTGEVQQRAIAMILGGRGGYGFIGLNSVNLAGQPISDSYNAATQNYPGAALAHKYGTFSSNGNIDVQGSVTVKGDLHPGVDKSITPYPLSQYVTITGYMNPLETPLTGFNPPVFTLPSYNNNSLITPASANNPNFTAKNATFPSVVPTAQKPTTNYVFTTWAPQGGDGTIPVLLKNDLGPINIYVNGNFITQGATRTVVASQNYPVTFWVNGTFDCGGQGISNTGKPTTLTINCTKAGATVIWRGQSELRAHIYAPTCNITATGQANFYGWMVGKTLNVSGQPLLHYDESTLPDAVPFTVQLVK